MTKLIIPELKLSENTEGITVERSQLITDDFLKGLADSRFESKNRREGEYMRVASIPTAVIDNWICRGIPFWDMDIPSIVALLKKDGLDAFLATEKNI